MDTKSFANDAETFDELTMPSDKLPEVLAASNSMGFWSGEIPKSGKPKLYGNKHMMYLLGIDEGTQISPQALHDHWYKRVDPDHHNEIKGYFNAIMNGEEAEIEYPWNHPKLGRILVRCGGRKYGMSKNGCLLQGYHRNITNVLHFQKHWHKSAAEMTFADSVLSFVARKMYSIVIMVNLKSNEFTFVDGTGMEQAVSEMRLAKNYRECYNYFYNHALPEYRKKLCALASLDHLLNLDINEGFAGMLKYVSTVHNKTFWREMTVYVGKDFSGNRIANILVRDIDSLKREQDAMQIELDAVNSRMRVFAEITQRMYGFNVTVDLKSGNFSVLIGTGLESVMPVIRSTHHYPTVLERMLSLVDEEYVKPLRALLGIDFLIATDASDSSLGTETFSVNVLGKRHWHEITVFRMNDELGNPTAHILCRDVTTLKEAEERHKREENNLRLKDIVFAQITRSIYGYNITINLNTLKYTLIEGNGTDNAIEIFKRFEYYQDAVDAKLKFIDPTHIKALLDVVSVKSLRSAAEKGHSGFLRTHVYKTIENNYEAWHEVSVFIGTNEHGEPIANLLGRDVTDIQKMHEKQFESERAANAARSYFFSTVSHDIRTPLNAIIGYSELLKIGIENKQERDQALDSVVTSSKALMHLINDVLDLSKLESGKMEIVNKPTDAFSIINETLSAFSLACSKKKIDLVRNIHDIPRLMLDSQRIRQLLFNIIGNAVKFTANGSITVTATYIDRELVISVKDTGIGIKKCDQKRIMTPYVQVHGSGRHGGTGLGLAICNQLALRMGGELSLESEFGSGSTFTITIPHVLIAEDNDEDEHNVKHPAQIEQDESMPELPQNILIVDDSIVNLKVLSAMLRKLGIKNIHQVACGKQALEMMQTLNVDLILTDVWMPGMNGVQFAETLRMNEREAGRDTTPICAVTADVETVKNNNNVKFDGILLKPITIDNLIALLKNFKKTGN